MSSADEGAAGISASPGDEGAALQRAQDKIATIQARAGAMDELPQSRSAGTRASWHRASTTRCDQERGGGSGASAL